ncbi:STAS domain-containing protein [Planobispora rosea]|uniref:STAS domain-containing protein n=1 Tax=Planobispora rosea TaxID=35762 RepID=UPI00083B6FE1|nr:STAS domain-containing protein [Planobispora rosea]
MRSDLTAVVLDAAGVPFCDSVGLSALIGVLKQSQAAHKRLALSGMHGTLARLLALTGLAQAFEIHDDVQQAIQAIQAAGSGA